MTRKRNWYAILAVLWLAATAGAIAEDQLVHATGTALMVVLCAAVAYRAKTKTINSPEP